MIVVVGGRRHGCDGGVLRVGMTAQVDLALERPRTHAARERLEPGVFAAVSNEVRRLTKGLATLTTHIRLLTCNRQEMRRHV